MIVNEIQCMKQKKTNISNIIKIRESKTEEDGVWDSIHKNLPSRRNYGVRSQEKLQSIVSYAYSPCYSKN